MHVRDASLAARVVGQLVNPQTEPKFVSENLKKQEQLRQRHANSAQRRSLISIEQARDRREQLAFDSKTVATPEFLGLRTLTVPLKELVPWIDWSPFFHAWELKGIYPAILQDERIGRRATELFDDGTKLLDEIVRDELLVAQGVVWVFSRQRVMGTISLSTKIHLIRVSRLGFFVCGSKRIAR